VEAAYAYHMAGNADKEEEMWKQLRDRGDTVKVGPEPRSVESLKGEIAKIARADTYVSLSDTPMERGSLNRNAQGIGGPPFLEKRWAQALLHETAGNATQNWITQAEKNLYRRQPV